MNAAQLNGTPLGYAFMLGGLVANLVAVLSIAAAGFIWVGKIDARLELTRESIAELKQRESVLVGRVGAAEQLSAVSEQRLRSIEAHLVELRAEVKRLSQQRQ